MRTISIHVKKSKSGLIVLRIADEEQRMEYNYIIRELVHPFQYDDPTSDEFKKEITRVLKNHLLNPFKLNINVVNETNMVDDIEEYS